MSQTHHITDLLQAWSNGDSQALGKLIPLVDQELEKTARAYLLNEKPDHTLQTKALVNEALIRLIEGKKISWENRRHFYALVAKRMRQVLTDHARGQLAAKRGRRPKLVPIEDAFSLSVELSEDLIVLDEALIKLAKVDERKEKVVELKYYGGYTTKEVAEVLDIAPSAVDNEWRLARSWLKRETTE
jgi:RNA polymerase sigma factor (TIGR02999 family)